MNITPNQRYRLARSIYYSLGISVNCIPDMRLGIDANNNDLEWDKVWIHLGRREGMHCNVLLSDNQLVEIARQIATLHESYCNSIRSTIAEGGVYGET